MILPLACALGLSAVHLLADRLRISSDAMRTKWLSVASGSSVAFVFLLLIPEVAARQEAVDEVALLAHFDHHVWFVALVGLVAFYAVEHWILTHSEQREETTRAAFWGHTGIFALYNMVVGYLLLDGQSPVADHVLAYALALGPHLLVIDDGMRRHHPLRYHRVGRWVLASAVMAGAATGAAIQLHEALPALALSLLAGGIVLNALKDELPEEREANVWPFAAGAAAYAFLVLLVVA